MAEDEGGKRMDLAEQAGARWGLWQGFLRLSFGVAVAIIVVLALMWIFLV